VEVRYLFICLCICLFISCLSIISRTFRGQDSKKRKKSVIAGVARDYDLLVHNLLQGKGMLLLIWRGDLRKQNMTPLVLLVDWCPASHLYIGFRTRRKLAIFLIYRIIREDKSLASIFHISQTISGDISIMVLRLQWLWIPWGYIKFPETTFRGPDPVNLTFSARKALQVILGTVSWETWIYWTHLRRHWLTAVHSL